MKKLLITLFAAGFAISLSAQEKEDYQMYQMVYMKPRADKVKEFEQKLAEHNKEYHTEGAMRVNIDWVSIGKHAGSYAWVQGPMTFSDLDELPENEAHEKHWDEEVMPFVESIQEPEFWKLQEKYSYYPEGDNGELDKVIVTFFDLVRGKERQFYEVAEKVKEVHEKNKYDEPFMLISNRFDAGSGRDVAIVSFFSKFASFDEDNNFVKDFEEINGPGSWYGFMNDFLESTVSSTDEIRIMRKDLGGTEE
jgi:hypothetical protein